MVKHNLLWGDSFSTGCPAANALHPLHLVLTTLSLPFYKGNKNKVEEYEEEEEEGGEEVFTTRQ